MSNCIQGDRQNSPMQPAHSIFGLIINFFNAQVQTRLSRLGRTRRSTLGISRLWACSSPWPGSWIGQVLRIFDRQTKTGNDRPDEGCVCWRLTALCELQCGRSCFEASVVCLVLCWFLAVLGVLWKRCKKSMPKPCQNHKKGFGGGPNPWKMAPKSDSGRIFDAGWQRVVPGTMFWRHFGATWPILAAILVPAGSQNEPFWHQISKKWEKWDPKKGVRKSMKK